MKPTIKEIQDRLNAILEVEGVKPKSKKAQLIEWAMLHGIILASSEAYPYLAILIMSGRSILNEK